jgi:hypothetical protein
MFLCPLKEHHGHQKYRIPSAVGCRLAPPGGATTEKGTRPAPSPPPSPQKVPHWSLPAGRLAAAKAAGLETAMLDRLTLSPKGVSIAEGVEQVAKLPDPISEMNDIKYRPSGIQVGKMACRSASSASLRSARTSPPMPLRCA